MSTRRYSFTLSRCNPDPPEKSLAAAEKPPPTSGETPRQPSRLRWGSSHVQRCFLVISVFMPGARRGRTELRYRAVLAVQSGDRVIEVAHQLGGRRRARTAAWVQLHGPL